MASFATRSLPACGTSGCSSSSVFLREQSRPGSTCFRRQPLAPCIQQASCRNGSRSHRRLQQPTRVFDNRNSNGDVGDRFIASLPYLLPLLDALPFGKFIFLEYPFIARALAPLGPLAQLYNTVPFAPFIIFLGVYNGIVTNTSFSRFVRYNAMQAVLLDILLIIPQVLLSSILKNPGGDALAFQAYITTNNTVFLFIAVSVAYGMGASLVGQSAKLPLVADAAEKQVNRGPGGF